MESEIIPVGKQYHPLVLCFIIAYKVVEVGDCHDVFLTNKFFKNVRKIQRVAFIITAYKTSDHLFLQISFFY